MFWLILQFLCDLFFLSWLWGESSPTNRRTGALFDDNGKRKGRRARRPGAQQALSAMTFREFLEEKARQSHAVDSGTAHARLGQFLERLGT